MTPKQTEELIRLLKIQGVRFEAGLTQEEIRRAEEQFKIHFPPDLKAILETSLPVSDDFVDWRKALISEKVADKVWQRMSWPLEGMLFDIEENQFWYNEWARMPEPIEERLEIAIKHFQTYPRLIPIFSHRYIPSTPNENGNPIFSVYQMDIIYLGYDLADYFANELHFELPSIFERLEKPKRKIEFWSDVVDGYVR